MCHLNDVKRPMTGQLLLFHSGFFFIMQNIRPYLFCRRSQGTGAHSRLHLPTALRALCSRLPVHLGTRATIYDLISASTESGLIAVKHRFVFASSFSGTDKSLGSFHSVCFLFNPFFVLNELNKHAHTRACWPKQNAEWLLRGGRRVGGE